MTETKTRKNSLDYLRRERGWGRIRHTENKHKQKIFQMNETGEREGKKKHTNIP